MSRFYYSSIRGEKQKGMHYCYFVVLSRQRRSHFISIGGAKLSFEGAKLRWKRGGGEEGTVPERKCKIWCDFVHSRVSFNTYFFFFFFLRHFYAPASIDRGHVVLPVSVCLSVRLSAENVTCELNIFL